MKQSTRLVLLTIALVASLPVFGQKRLPNSPRNVLSLSDIHFNPFYDSTLVESLVTSDGAAWEGIFQSSAITTPNSYGSDANYPLFRSALQAMRQQVPSPFFLVISGDFLCHDFQSTYSSYAPRHPDSLKSFTDKTIRFVAAQLKKQFPTTVVLPVLGNNDSYCGDYNVQPDGDFLRMFAKAWVPLLHTGSAAEDARFVRQFSKGGYYTRPFPGGVKGQLVLVNSVFFSAKYDNACGDTAATPGIAEMAWLDATLKANKAAGRDAWLVFHIPPGIDVYSSLKGHGSCPANTKSMWQGTFNTQFLALAQQYRGQIKAMLAGHTHMDDFRVLYDAGKPFSFIHITPGISPLFGNNPGFQRIRWNSATRGLQNAETFYLNVGTSPSVWSAEYNFQKAYNVPGINSATLNTVRQKILTDTVYRNRYIQLYQVSHPLTTGITLQNWMAYWCGTGALTAADFSACWCTGASK